MPTPLDRYFSAMLLGLFRNCVVSVFLPILTLVLPNHRSLSLSLYHSTQYTQNLGLIVHPILEPVAPFRGPVKDRQRSRRTLQPCRPCYSRVDSLIAWLNLLRTY